MLFLLPLVENSSSSLSLMTSPSHSSGSLSPTTSPSHSSSGIICSSLTEDVWSSSVVRVTAGTIPFFFWCDSWVESFRFSLFRCASAFSALTTKDAGFPVRCCFPGGCMRWAVWVL
ncbi:hypothetical protein FKM82_004829 [Ascaphus truei]